MNGRALVVWILAVCSFVASRSAATSMDFYFYDITHTDPVNAATAPQFTGTLATYSSNYVQLTIRNAAGGAQSSITDIYFDDSAHILSSMTIVNSSGVSYSNGASPTNLPGIAAAGVSFTPRYSADSDYPTITDGVNPGEYVNFRFKADYNTVVQNLTTNCLRLGVYVQGYANGYSESFISTTTPPPGAPAPGALALGFMGLIFTRFMPRRKPVRVELAAIAAI
jgi:hypothetical protein